MTDKTDPDPQQKTPEELESEKREEGFWKSFEAHLDSWFDNKVKTVRESGTGDSRMGGRRTLPKIIDEFLSYGSKK